MESIIFRYRPFISHINLRGCAPITSRALKAVGTVCSFLILAQEQCSLSSFLLTAHSPSNNSLFLQCRNLQDLNLSDCQQIRDAGIKAVAEGCTSLIYLNLACCSITDLSLKFLAKHCRNLGYLRSEASLLFGLRSQPWRWLGLYIGSSFCLFPSLAGDADITDRGAAYLSEGQGCKKLYWLVSQCA